MTEYHRIATSVDRELRDAEPTTAVDADAALARGRSALRRKRGSLALAGLAAATVLGVGLANLPLGEGAEKSSASDAAVEYVPQAMPDLLEASFRTAVRESVVELGPATFFAGSSDFEELPADRYDQAKFMYVDFGQPGTREWRLYVGRLASDTEGNPDSCKDAPEAGVMSCVLSRTEAGEIIRTQVTVGLLLPDVGEYQWVDYRNLDPAQWDDVRLERTVSVIRDGGFEASAREWVFGPSVLSPEAFQVSSNELLAAATDESIYFGEPAR